MIVIQGVKIGTRQLEQSPDSLATRLADGDPRAPRDLVEWHYSGLYRYAFAMLRDGGAAEDAVHDAFVNALEALAKYPEGRIRGMRLRPWLYCITLNVVRNRVRRRREFPVEERPAVVERDGNPEGVMDALAALERLPEKQRVAVTLRHMQDLPYAEIADATGWPENTVKTLARRGIQRLRTDLETEERR